MELDQPVSLWGFSRAAEERNESEEEARVLVKKKKGGKKIQSSLIIIEAGNGGSAQGRLTGHKLVMLFWVILSHTGRRPE